MKARALVAAIVSASLVSAPVRGRADEARPAAREPVRIFLTHAEALATPAPIATAFTARTHDDVTEIRLSEGAKTAIIVGAVVVGVLVIAGVVALGGPGKHLK